MSTTIQGKVGVVTGGTRGIGYNIAEALLAAGAKVFICGRDANAVKGAVEHLGGPGAKDQVAGLAADVRRHEDCSKVIQGAAQRFGGIDILVNNAGIGIFKPVDQLSIGLSSNLSPT